MNQPIAAAYLAAVDYDPFADAPLARVVPTTEPQREVWLASQLGTEASLAYNESVSLHLRGPLRVQALRSALQVLVDRHEALRATVSADGQSLYLANELALEIPLTDLCALPSEAQAAARAEALRRAVELPFDLEHGPLVRAEMLALAPDDHLLVLSAHHIVCDGWSFGVLVTELQKLYAEMTGHGGEPLRDADSFATFALAQMDEEHSNTREADTAYWVSVYDDSVPVLELPTDRPRKPLRSFASRREETTLDAKLVDSVRKLGAAQGASLFVTMFGMFSALLSRLSGSDEVVVGVPAAGQAAEGFGPLVGHCVNLLPIRVATNLEQDIATLLGQTNGRVLDAYEHQHCTYGSLLKKLQVQRDPGRLPLVSVLFNLDSSIDTNALSVGDLHVELSSNPRHFENFDLFLNASQVAGAVVLECQYNSDLFDAATVQRWLALYRTALQRAVADPASPLALAFAPTNADTQLIATFNVTDSDWPRDKRIEALIAQQVSASPDRIAVTAGQRHLRYRDLDASANALAVRLRSLGAGPGSMIGLACGRNEHMIVGLLGILKSGAGYIPLDPAFPEDRLEFMAADAGLRHVVSDRSVSSSLKLHSAERVIVDDLGAQADCPAPLGSADDVAYVIYTSGSTGRPKGVLVPHRAVTNLLASVRKEPGMTAGHTVLSVTTLSFDIAVSEVILPLTVGARIVVADREQATDGDRLLALIESQRVDFIDATPSTWRLLLAANWKGCQQMTAICTGEPLPPDLGRELLPLVGSLWNGYGPTETTVWSSFHKVKAINGPVPIGHPIANTTIHVVDAQLRPLPVGVTGELFIGGSGVTLGYLGRPDLTAERFLLDPFSAKPGARWYRTGDRGRWRADGVLECLGRSDHQVKVRGYRIELGEIEASLLTHPDLARALVVTREDRPGDVRLVAYAVARSGAKVDIVKMQSHLRRTLPDYMIPQHLVQLNTIPLLPNGKIDRNALPRPELDATVGGQARLAARTPLEQQVLAAMEQVLDLPGLGVRDDFFALGGHSLLAARLTARLNREFELNMPLRTLFESPSTEKLTLAVEKAREANTPKRKPLVHQPGRVTAPLTPGQERICFLEELQPGRVLYNTPSGHLLAGPMDVTKFELALREVVRRQPSLRTFIGPNPDGPGHVQIIAETVEFDLPYEDLTRLPEAGREPELMRRMQAIVDTPIDIHRGPLFRVALYKLAEELHGFLFMPHHIIWDGWSFDLLYDEMSASYGALVAGSANPLPALPVSYGDYAQWHAEWMQGPEFEEQLRYWKNRFVNAPIPKALRPDHPRRPGNTGEGASEWIHLDKAFTERLREIARRADSTLNMLTMAVYTAMMANVVGGDSVVIGVPVRGRSMAEVEPIMGFFNNLLPVQLAVNPELRATDFVRGIKKELLEAFSHQDIPFERLAAEPAVAARSQRIGLYQALFSFQDARERKRQWGGLSHKTILIAQKGATQDLGLWLMEVPGGLEGGITYNTDIYASETARAFRERYVELLTRLANNPELMLAEMMASADSPSAQYLRRLAPPQETDGLGPSSSKLDATVRPANGAPMSATQRAIAEVWAALLGVEVTQITLQDNFFELGGTSLLAMQAVSQLEQCLGRSVSARRYVFETLSQLAAGYEETPAAVQARPKVDPVPRTGMMQRLVKLVTRA